MVDGIVEEKFSSRTGLLSRLFAWSPEEDKTEQHIQMAPIDPAMWAEFREFFLHQDERTSDSSSEEEESSESDERAEHEEYEEYEESEGEEQESASSKDLSNPYDLSYHETRCIESVLECIDKCRLDLLYSSSSEWSNNTLLVFVNSAMHLYESPYRIVYSSFQNRIESAKRREGVPYFCHCMHVFPSVCTRVTNGSGKGKHQAV